MPKYFHRENLQGGSLLKYDSDMYTLASAMGRAMLNLKENKQKEYFQNLAKDYLLGNPLKLHKSYDPIEFPGLPKRTGDTKKDLQTINEYLKEFIDELPKLKNYEALSSKEELQNVFQNYYASNPLEAFAESAGKIPSFEDARFAIESTLTDDNRFNARNMNAEKLNRFTLFQSLTFNHGQRGTPKWYEFGKRFNMWREEKALKKLEENLIAIGISQKSIDGAKNMEAQSKESVESGITQTSIDRVTKLRSFHYAQESKLPDENVVDFDSPKGRNYLSKMIPAYLQMKELHDKTVPVTDSEKKFYQQETKFLADLKTKMSNNFDVSDSKNKKFFDTLFEKGFDEAYQARDNENEQIRLASQKELVVFDEKDFSDNSYEIFDEKMLDERISEKEIENYGETIEESEEISGPEA